VGKQSPLQPQTKNYKLLNNKTTLNRIKIIEKGCGNEGTNSHLITDGLKKENVV
jgi:hypothetical protein